MRIRCLTLQRALFRLRTKGYQKRSILLNTEYWRAPPHHQQHLRNRVWFFGPFRDPSPPPLYGLCLGIRITEETCREYEQVSLHCRKMDRTGEVDGMCRRDCGWRRDDSNYAVAGTVVQRHQGSGPVG